MKYRSFLYLLSIATALFLTLLALSTSPAAAASETSVTDSGLPGWVPYVGGGILLLLIILLGYLITRRRGTK